MEGGRGEEQCRGTRGVRRQAGTQELTAGTPRCIQGQYQQCMCPVAEAEYQVLLLSPSQHGLLGIRLCTTLQPYYSG